MRELCKDKHEWGPLLYEPKTLEDSFDYCFSPPDKVDQWLNFCVKCGYSELSSLGEEGWIVEEKPRWTEWAVNRALEFWKDYHKENTRFDRILDFMESMYESLYISKGTKIKAESFCLKDGFISADEGDPFPGVALIGLNDYSGPFLVFFSRDKLEKDLAVYFTEFVLSLYHSLDEFLDVIDKGSIAFKGLMEEICRLQKNGSITYDSGKDIWW
jgi:hypothetical protein